MARKQIVNWPRQPAQSHRVWSSASDGALRVILRHSDLGWNRLRPSNLVDRILPIAAVAIAGLSGIIIGWALFVP